MKLTDVLSSLAYGELSHIAAGGVTTGIVDPAYLPAVINHINHALSDLHTKYELRNDDVTIDLNVAVTRYVLDYKYAQSNVDSLVPYKWISDSVTEPFEDNVIAIEAVFQEDFSPVPLNDEVYCDSVYTPFYNVVEVPDPKEGQSLHIYFRADHPRLDPNMLDTEGVEINVSSVFRNAICYYVANRFFASMGTPESTEQGRVYLQKYEMNCKELEDKGMIPRANTTNTKLESNGWV